MAFRHEPALGALTGADQAGGRAPALRTACTARVALCLGAALLFAPGGCGDDERHGGTAPPPGPPGGSTRPDAGSGDAGGDAGRVPGRIRGVVCVAESLLSSTCVPATESGLSVFVEPGQASASVEGGVFDVEGPASAGAVVVRTSTDPPTLFGGARRIVWDPSVGADGVTLVLFSREYVADVLAQSGATRADGHGIVATYVTMGGLPAEGALLSPVQDRPPHYDTRDPRRFVQDAGVGPAGIGVWFDLTPGPITYTVTYGNAGENFQTAAVADALTLDAAVLGTGEPP